MLTDFGAGFLIGGFVVLNWIALGLIAILLNERMENK